MACLDRGDACDGLEQAHEVFIVELFIALCIIKEGAYGVHDRVDARKNIGICVGIHGVSFSPFYLLGSKRFTRTKRVVDVPSLSSLGYGPLGCGKASQTN